MKIVPALLAEDFRTFTDLVRLAERFTDYVQVDLMDGRLVPTHSFPAKDLNNLVTSLCFEVHLMGEDPRAAFEGLHNPMLRQLVFHIESGVRAQEMVRTIRGKGLKAGIALNPGTDVEVLRGLEGVDAVLVMTVDPGRYGSPFRAEGLEKIAGIRRLLPGCAVGVDGGVSLDNLQMIRDAGADYACVGSRILLQPDPGASYREFVRRSNR
mgnify:CR=1 FL=1